MIQSVDADNSADMRPHQRDLVWLPIYVLGDVVRAGLSRRYCARLQFIMDLSVPLRIE